MLSTGLSRRQVVAGSLILPLTLALGCAGKPVATRQPTQTVSAALLDLKRKLRKHVADKQRRTRAMAKLDELHLVVLEFDRIAYDWRTESRASLMVGPDRTALYAIADRMNSRFRAQLVSAVEIGDLLRADILEHEWLLVFSAAQERS